MKKVIHIQRNEVNGIITVSTNQTKKITLGFSGLIRGERGERGESIISGNVNSEGFLIFFTNENNEINVGKFSDLVNTSNLVNISDFETFSGETNTRITNLENGNFNLSDYFLVTDFINYSGQTANELAGKASTDSLNFKLDKSEFNSFSGNTNNRILTLENQDFNTDNLVSKSEFNSFSGNTSTLIAGKASIDSVNLKLDKAEFSSFSGATNTTLNSKVATTEFINYTGNTSNEIAGKASTDSVNLKLDKSEFNSFSGVTNNRILTLENQEFNTDNLVSKSEFNSFSGATNTALNSKLATTEFVNYTGNTSTLIAGKASIDSVNLKLDKAEFSSFSGATNTTLNSKLATTDFVTYTGNTSNEIASKASNNDLILKLDKAEFASFSGNTNTALNSKLAITDFNSYSGNTSNLIASKASNNDLNLKLNITDFENYTGVTTTEIASKESLSNKNQANGYAGLNSSGLLPLNLFSDEILGNVKYEGIYNVVTNTPNLGNAIDNKGVYYIVDVGGVFYGITYNSGDWIISNGIEWGKVSNTDAVTTVFGRNGNIIANYGDYAAEYISLDSTNFEANNVKDGLIEIDNKVSNLSNSKLNKAEFASFSGATNTTLDSKLNTTDFNSYSGNTFNEIAGKASIDSVNLKLDKSEFNSFSGVTNTTLNSKLATTDFVNYTGNTSNEIASKASTDSVNLKLDTSIYTAYTGVTATQINAKANDSEVVKLTSNQTIGGTKTFSVIPVLPNSNPTTSNQAARKLYVDNLVSPKLDKSEFQAFTGTTLTLKSVNNVELSPNQSVVITGTTVLNVYEQKLDILNDPTLRALTTTQIENQSQFYTFITSNGAGTIYTSSLTIPSTLKEVFSSDNNLTDPTDFHRITRGGTDVITKTYVAINTTLSVNKNGIVFEQPTTANSNMAHKIQIKFSNSVASASGSSGSDSLTQSWWNDIEGTNTIIFPAKNAGEQFISLGHTTSLKYMLCFIELESPQTNFDIYKIKPAFFNNIEAGGNYLALKDNSDIEIFKPNPTSNLITVKRLKSGTTLHYIEYI